MLRAVILNFFAILLLAGCVTTNQREPVMGTADGTTSQIGGVNAAGTPMPAATGLTTPQGTLREPLKVAILVPQSGANAQIGEALLQAAQLAVFDLNEPGFELIPKDTKGTAEGTKAAVDEAAHEGVKLILGPLFAQEVDAAKNAARGYGLTVIGFSTDWRVAGDNVYSMGVLPFGQAERVAAFAAGQGLKRVAVVAPGDMYGDAVTSAFQQTAQRYGIQIVKAIRISADGSDAANAVNALNAAKGTFDALFMPIGGQTIHTMASMLQSYGLGSNAVRYLGTGLWDEPSIISDPNMMGAIYAAPSPAIRAGFERNYQRIYGVAPPRLASIGYDSAALAIVLAKNAAAAGQRVTFNRASLTNPNGFSGVDGIFRFGQNGLAERGMAILQIAGGRANQVEPAPASFLGN